MTDQPKFFCPCGKFITATKAGNYRHHTSYQKEAFSRFHRLCDFSGAPIKPECEER